MKKVVYSVEKLGRFDNPKLTGVGCIADNSLIIAMMSKNGKPYIKAFQDIYEYIHPLVEDVIHQNRPCKSITVYDKIYGQYV